MPDFDKPVRTRYTVLHVREDWLNVEHAVSLLDPAYTGYDLTSTGKDGWTTLAMTEQDAETLAPALAGTLNSTVYLVAVDGGRCAVSVAEPGQPLAQKTFADSAEPDLSGPDLHRRALRALGVPETCADRPRPTAGVLVVAAPPETVRTKLPDADHGAWLLPIAGHENRSAVVSDGTGWEPDAEAIQSGLADHNDLSLIAVTWWDAHEDNAPGGYLEVLTSTDSYEVDLGSPTTVGESAADPTRSALTRSALTRSAPARSTGADSSPATPDPKDQAREMAGAAHAFATLLELDESGPAAVLEAIEQSRTDLPGACARLLALAGVPDVPPGANATELATWAADNDQAIRLTDATGVPAPELRRTVAEARHKYLRRHRIRALGRWFAWAGLVAFLVGLALLIWGPPVWTTAAFAIAVLVAAGSAAVLRLLRPRQPHSADR